MPRSCCYVPIGPHGVRGKRWHCLRKWTTFARRLTLAAIFMLGVVLFVGVTTIVRLAELNQEDMRLVLGMNRLRRGYLDMHPELEPYFLTGSHDDLGGLMLTLGMNMAPSRLGAHELAHQLQTLPGMLGVIVAAVASVLAALIAVVFGAPTSMTVLVSASAFLICAVLLNVLTRHAFNMVARDMTVRFPSMGQQSMRRRPHTNWLGADGPLAARPRVPPWRGARARRGEVGHASGSASYPRMARRAALVRVAPVRSALSRFA